MLLWLFVAALSVLLVLASIMGTVFGTMGGKVPMTRCCA